MATMFLSMVKPKILDTIPGRNKWFKNIDEELMDTTLYVKNGPCPQEGCGSTKNQKKILISVPSIREMLTPFLIESIEKEMKNTYYHNIRYIKVDNRTFYKRLKKYKTHKFRYFYQGKFKTLYFNLQSKSLLLKENFAVNLSLFATFPSRGLNAGMPKPCEKRGNMGPCNCDATDWAITSWLKSIDPRYEEWWQIHCIPDYKKACAPTGKPCYDRYAELEHDSYYYTKPGENDYMIECYTLENPNNSGTGWNNVEYYILDREGEYFKKGTKNRSRYGEWVLSSYNNQEYSRIELYHDSTKCVKARFVTDSFTSLDELFDKIGFSWYGRHNTYYYYTLRCMMYYNNEVQEGFYCPPPPKLKIDFDSGKLITPKADGVKSDGVNDLSEDAETLIKPVIDWYDKPDLSIVHLDDIKIFQKEQILYFDINSDKYLDKIRINGNTNDDFLDYAVRNYFS